MIFVTHQLPVNVPGEPRLGPRRRLGRPRAQGQQRAAVRAQHDLLRGHQRYGATPSSTATSSSAASASPSGSRWRSRTGSPSPGSPGRCSAPSPTRSRARDDDLQLRFSFALVVTGVEGGSAAEQEYADSMTGDYLKAVAATLNAMRRIAADKAVTASTARLRGSSVRRSATLSPASTDLCYPERQLRCALTSSRWPQRHRALPASMTGCGQRIAEQLAGQFKGDIIGPDHAEYEDARQVWNAMIDRRPGLILRCTSTADVVAAVNVAREHGLYPSVRCGGHNVAGKAHVRRRPDHRPERAARGHRGRRRTSWSARAAAAGSATWTRPLRRTA